jgi:hypothetical protein
MKNLTKVVEFINGKKTYIVAIAALVWGFYQGDSETILLGLGLIGLRNGITNELTKVLVKKKK